MLKTNQKKEGHSYNYISLVASVATFLLLVGRYFFVYIDGSIIIALLEGCLFFLIPIILNFLDILMQAGIFLCWSPSIFQLYSTHEVMKEIAVPETSNYVGVEALFASVQCFSISYF